MSRLPFLHYSTRNHPREEAYDTWRQLMSPMYEIRPVARVSQLPGGGTILFQLGDVLVNRTVFTTQRVSRDRKRIDTSPDHILFQFWRTGGYVGEVAGRDVTLRAGVVAIADRRRELSGVIGRADTLGLILPRTVLRGLDTESYGMRLDPRRNLLLQARITNLYAQLPRTMPGEVPALSAEIIAFMRRLLDPSPAPDVLEGVELDGALLPLARRVALRRLPDPALTPAAIALDLRVSRATLYRIFAPIGGVMAFVYEQRLLAVRDALADPLETRSLARLAEDHGISSPSQLSRSFRTRFGLSPRAWRAAQEEHARRHPSPGVATFWSWFNALGR